MATKSSIFTKPFLSVGGQKERISNVVGTLKAAVTGQGVQSNTGNKTADKVLSLAASHPFITAGIATAGITAVKSAPAILSSVSSKTAIIGGKTISSGALFGLAGLGIGAALSGGKATTGDQTTTPTQNPQINTTPTQTTTTNTNYTTNTDNSIWQKAGRDIGALNQSNPLNQSPTISPQQSTPSSLTAAQTTTPQQTATTGATNWVLIAGLGLAAYLLFGKNKR